jgi:lysophospholipase L1-like esterase
MAKITQNISVEVSKPNFFAAIVAKQYDSGSRYLKATFIHDSKVVQIPNTSTTTINAKRSDGEEKSFAGKVNNDNTVTVPLASWMLELVGTVKCDISVLGTDGSKLTSTTFVLEVQEASCESGDISSDENYNVLIKLIEDVGKITPDQTYKPTSEQAQSGKAVAEAISGSIDLEFISSSTNAQSGLAVTEAMGKALDDGMRPIVTNWEHMYIYSDGSSLNVSDTITSSKIEGKVVKIEHVKGYHYVRRFYDSTGNFIKGDGAFLTETTINNLDDGGFLRICVRNTSGGAIGFDEALPIYKSTLISDNKKRVDEIEIKVDEISPSVNDLSEGGTIWKNVKNLYNPNAHTAIKGGYERGGKYVAASTYNQTGLIAVNAGENYTASYRNAFVSWYKADKTFLEETDSGTFSKQGYVTAPADAKYVRFVYLVSGEATFQVEIGTSSTAYEPYCVAFYKKRFLNIGAANFVSYGDSIVERNKWQPFIENNYGFAHTNLGIGSTTVAYISERETEFPCMINANRIKAIKTANPDLIVIMGGTNDCHLAVPLGEETQLSKALGNKDKTTFYGAYSFLLETLLTWKPGLKIILMTPMQSNWEVRNNYDDYAEAIRKIAYYFAIPIADSNRKGGVSHFNVTTYTEDGLHPNEKGGRVIANIVAEQINGTYLI